MQAAATISLLPPPPPLLLLLQRKKTEMEDLFSTAIPQQQRGGSRFVFRQGNPLNAGDLKLVAAGALSFPPLVTPHALPLSHIC
jgi:hypothetical protein